MSGRGRLAGAQRSGHGSVGHCEHLGSSERPFHLAGQAPSLPRSHPLPPPPPLCCILIDYPVFPLFTSVYSIIRIHKEEDVSFL